MLGVAYSSKLFVVTVPGLLSFATELGWKMKSNSFAFCLWVPRTLWNLKTCIISMQKFISLKMHDELVKHMSGGKPPSVEFLFCYRMTLKHDMVRHLHQSCVAVTSPFIYLTIWGSIHNTMSDFCMALSLYIYHMMWCLMIPSIHPPIHPSTHPCLVYGGISSRSHGLFFSYWTNLNGSLNLNLNVLQDLSWRMRQNIGLTIQRPSKRVGVYV